MTLYLPNELWLNIFKRMDSIDLFEKRKVCKHFKNLIDNNLKYFYIYNAKRYPRFYQQKKEHVTIDDFINSSNLFFIEQLVNYKCNPFCLKFLMNKKPCQIKLVIDLYKTYNIWFVFAKNCIELTPEQLSSVIDFKKLGFSDYFSVKYGSEFILTDNKINLVKKLQEKNISSYFSYKIISTFSDLQVETFFRLLNLDCDLDYINAIQMIENGYTCET